MAQTSLSAETAAAGRIVFMPWLHLPRSVSIGAFRFAPVEVDDLASVIGPEIGETAAQAMRTHVDQAGKPIKVCTIVLRPRHSVIWDIPASRWDAARRASEMLALACLSEQRFFMGHFSPHMNATMFRLVGQGISAGSGGIGLTYPRRGGSLMIGGRTFDDVVFQQPPQIEGTDCGIVNGRLLKAFQSARQSRNPVWEPIVASFEFFLLGHAETLELGWDTCIMLSAMAFEQLLEPKGQGAQALAKAFAALWATHATKTMAQAKRVRPDPKWSADQQSWPIHQKWIKELFEARNSRAHRGPVSDFRVNWADWQHMIIAAFVYPLAIKLRLATAGFYDLSDEELGRCEALDHLLDSDWGKGWRQPPEWPELLSSYEDARSWSRLVERASVKVQAKHSRESLTEG
jgi:hypothetical protein